MVRVGKEKSAYFFLIIVIFLLLFGYGLNTLRNSGEASISTNKVTASDSIPVVDLSFIPDIDYTYLDDLWYNQKIEMLIISPNDNFTAELIDLRDWKNEKGVKTIILSNFSLYEGRDDAEKIRNMIKSYYEKENIQWVLLAGDTELIPIRNVYNPDVIKYGEGQTEAFPGEYYKPTDFYYADLTGSWDSDGDDIWGESPQYNDYGLDEISWIPEVYVGRFPASNEDELEDMVTKSLKYEKDPFIDGSNWMNKMLLVGGVSSSIPLEDEAVLTTYISSNYVLNEMEFTHLHRTASPFDPPLPPAPNRQEALTSTNVKTEMSLGYSTAIIASHGYFANFQGVYGGIFDIGQANTLNNTNKPFLMYGDACTTSSYDVGDNNIGEVLIKKENAGAIGYIGGLRVTWYFENDDNLEKLNRGNAKLFWKEFFLNKKFQQGKALYDSKVAYINSEYYRNVDPLERGSTDYEFERKNLLTYNLLGDPEVDIYTDKPKIAINPFVKDIYEGQLVSIIIKNVDGKIVPRARVHLEGSNGKYYTVYADENGIAKLQMFAQENEFYNVSITGHNLIKSFFNFTTLPDIDKPELRRIQFTPKNPFTSDKITFNIEIIENSSILESVYLVLSKNNFHSCSSYAQSNIILEEGSKFSITIDRLVPGDYSFLLFARDFANNTNIFYNFNLDFLVPKPITGFILPISIIVAVIVVGISSYVLLKGLRKLTRITMNLE